MRILQVGSLSLFLWLVCSLPVLSQDSASPAPPTAATGAAPAAQGAEPGSFCASGFLQ